MSNTTEELNDIAIITDIVRRNIQFIVNARTEYNPSVFNAKKSESNLKMMDDILESNLMVLKNATDRMVK